MQAKSITLKTRQSQVLFSNAFLMDFLHISYILLIYSKMTAMLTEILTIESVLHTKFHTPVQKQFSINETII